MSEHLAEAERKLESAIQVIFQIGTGALAVSITFRGQIAPQAASAKWLLSLSWICLAIVPVSYVFLRLMESAQSIFWDRKHREIAESAKRGVQTKPITETPPELAKLQKQAAFCWKSMIFSFLAGVILLLLFGLVNNGL